MRTLLSWSRSALVRYPTVRARGRSFPARSLLARQTPPGPGWSVQRPHHGPLPSLVLETVNDGFAHGGVDGVEEGERHVFVRAMCAVGVHVREQGRGIAKADHSQIGGASREALLRSRGGGSAEDRGPDKGIGDASEHQGAEQHHDGIS